MDPPGALKDPQPPPNPSPNPYQTFARALLTARRILCLIGAGLSAPSGLATWRGSSGHWQNHALKALASPEKFESDPVTVWRFYGERLLEALAAKPNAGHYAIGALAAWRGQGEWLSINQNVDGLLEQTAHPASSLLSLHGTLRTIRCTVCSYTKFISKPEDLPFLVTLANGNSNSDSLGTGPSNTSDPSFPQIQPQQPEITLSSLPHCPAPACNSLLRPSVVWFGERLAAGAPDSIDDWMAEDEIDLVIAAGTSLEVFPAAEWVHTAREYGANLAIFDATADHQMRDELDENEWYFQGDIAVVLPGILRLLQQR